jgi:hypothetical protein
MTARVGGDPMKPANPSVKLTYDDYVHFPEDGLRHELIDGEHYVTPTPIRKHQAIDEYWIAIRSSIRSTSTGLSKGATRARRSSRSKLDALTIDLLPGLTLPLSTIFED